MRIFKKSNWYFSETLIFAEIICLDMKIINLSEQDTILNQYVG